MGYLAAFVYTAGSLVCHQIAARSFHVAGVQLPVCARCTGLYAGALAGVIVWLVWARRGPRVVPTRALRRVLVFAAAPTAFTLATAAFGWWDPGNALRAALAAPLGLVLGGVVAAVAAGDLR